MPQTSDKARQEGRASCATEGKVSTIAMTRASDLLPELPAGLQLSRLPDRPDAAHAAARAFCLEVIREFYGFEYREDWHADLDSLRLPAAENQFSTANRGAFWTLTAADGAIVATTGIKRLTWQPKIVAALADRYPHPERVATLVRAYVRKDQRGRGLGRWLNHLCEAEARRLGFADLYLHASSDAPATIGFWKANGYTDIGEFGFSTHFDKRLAAP